MRNFLIPVDKVGQLATALVLQDKEYFMIKDTQSDLFIAMVKDDDFVLPHDLLALEIDSDQLPTGYALENHCTLESGEHQEESLLMGMDIRFELPKDLADKKEEIGQAVAAGIGSVIRRVIEDNK